MGKSIMRSNGNYYEEVLGYYPDRHPDEERRPDTDMLKEDDMAKECAIQKYTVLREKGDYVVHLEGTSEFERYPADQMPSVLMYMISEGAEYEHEVLIEFIPTEFEPGK